MTIDVTFDFRRDSGGEDPDRWRPTLRRFHEVLWRKPLRVHPRCVTQETFDFKHLKFSTVEHVSTRTTHHTYSIKEAATLTGLPASTLRYYESIGVISPISRGESSKHRVYSEDDLDTLTWIACLSATGMSVSDMRQYVSNGSLGPVAAKEQIELLTTQRERLALEAGFIALRSRYVQLKIDYWHAVDADDDARADLLAGEARALADELKKTRKN